MKIVPLSGIAGTGQTVADLRLSTIDHIKMCLHLIRQAFKFLLLFVAFSASSVGVVDVQFWFIFAGVFTSPGQPSSIEPRLSMRTA